MRNIKTSASNISGYKNLYPSLLKVIKVKFSHVLWDISMHDLNLKTETSTFHFESFSISFSLTEDKSLLIISCIVAQNSRNTLNLVLISDVNLQVLDVLSWLVLKVLSEIYSYSRLKHVLSDNFLNPVRESGWEHALLDMVLVSYLHLQYDLIDVFFEAHLKHLISLVEDQAFKAGKVDISSLNMIKNSACGSNEEIDSSAKVWDLLLNRNTSINSDDFVLGVIVFERVHDFWNLNRQLSRGAQTDSLQLISADLFLRAQSLDQRQTISQCLAWTCEISADYVVAVVNRVEALLLDRE